MSTSRSPDDDRLPHRAFIALGSNEGDRLYAIESACNFIEQRSDLIIQRTSGLWETKAMYVEDQADFLNAVIEVETSLSPLELLDCLQRIENKHGRRRTVAKGPRTLDLDILLYDDVRLASERLTLPHPLMLERAFVLEPLCELIPETLHPYSRQSYATHLAALPPTPHPPTTITPLSESLPPLTPLSPTRRTMVMGIANLTPDSFSRDPLTSETLLPALTAQLAAGAHILDIGAQSTRPNSTPLSASSEIDRLTGVPHALHSLRGPHATSIDTYHVDVARTALPHFDIINDVSGGLWSDNELFNAVWRSDKIATVIIGHTRGLPGAMSGPPHTHYNDLIPDIAAELRDRVDEAVGRGVRRWRVILDPGIGFSKTHAQNLEILRRLPELRAAKGLRGLPWCVGVSRKGFIGALLGGREVGQRTYGGAAAVAAAVAGGADVVRVHDVAEMRDVVAVADGIWRTGAVGQAYGTPKTGVVG
ncbi:Dihydropteroate synthase [Trichodelitschia bisporula]|uniref:Dihydropteroate synthase n=1 Tax=Trichodelitschia bisporula TaxID=703511 RepID=A0A6G1I577_9PEZI|nr:Dihydropteroate synthase [Trichodelitschia bisporula]